MKSGRFSKDVPVEGEALHLSFNDARIFRDLLGHHDEHLKIIQRTLGVRIQVRGNEMDVTGDPV